MHKNFADWYREADLEPTADTIENRYSAIDAYLEDINEEKCLNLVKLLFGFSVEEEFIEDFIEYFVNADPTFPRRDNQFELSILSGATIVHTIENKKKYKYISAIATITGSFKSKKDTPPLQDIILEAENFIKVESSKLRIDLSSFSLPNKQSLNQLAKSLNDNKDNIEASAVSNHHEIGKILYQMVSMTKTHLNELTNKVINTTNKMSKSLSLISEENNILWWVFGEYRAPGRNQVLFLTFF